MVLDHKEHGQILRRLEILDKSFNTEG